MAKFNTFFSKFFSQRNVCGLTSSNKLKRRYHKLNYGFKLRETEYSPALQYSTGNSKNLEVYCWGLAEHGGLGLHKSKKTNFRYIARPVKHHLSDQCEITNIECGIGFTLFTVKSSSPLKLFGCGINTDSQIGFHDSPQNIPLEILLAPAAIELGLDQCDTLVTSVSAGRAHTVVVTDKEGAFTMGSNCYGQCGRPVIEEEKYCGSKYIHRILEIDGEQIIDAFCGQDHTFFLTEGKKVYSCGLGTDGQLGLGDISTNDCPKRVCGEIEGEDICKIAGKSDTALALNTKGEVFGWGNNEYNQLGPSKMGQIVHKPRRLGQLKCFGKIIDIACGGAFSMVLNECGDVFVWGYGILGCGPAVLKSETPIQIPKRLFGCNEWQPDARVTSISCGLSHCAAINNYCNLYMWGKNRSGCLGIGHIRDQFFPYKVAICSNVINVSCGFDHSLSLCKPFT